MQTYALLLIALVVLPFLVRIVSGSDKITILYILAVLAYAAHLAGFVQL